jgi:hypothetical protein
VKVSVPQKFGSGEYVMPVPPPVISAVPFAPFDFEATVFGPPSMSVSLARTSTALPNTSSVTVIASFTAIGASSTHVTVIATVVVRPPFSV